MVIVERALRERVKSSEHKLILAVADGFLTTFAIREVFSDNEVRVVYAPPGLSQVSSYVSMRQEELPVITLSFRPDVGHPPSWRAFHEYVSLTLQKALDITPGAKARGIIRVLYPPESIRVVSGKGIQGVSNKLFQAQLAKPEHIQYLQIIGSPY